MLVFLHVVKKMESPQNNIWGPHLWTILHSLAERKKNSSEETRLWTGLLSSLRYSLPCPQCKKHYSDYYTAHPVSDIRTWLYNLHNEVNGRTGKEGIAIDQLSDYSKPFHFTYHYSIVHTHMMFALRIGWCNHNDIKRTVRFLNEIKCFYDLF